MANSVPTLTGLDSAIFVENIVNAAPQVIDAAVTLVDFEDDFSGRVLIVADLLPEDIVSIRDQGPGAGQIGFSNGFISYEGSVIGVALGGAGAPLTVVFTLGTTTAAVDALIQNLTYANSSDAPTSSRTLAISITDSATAAAIPLRTFTARAGAANPFDGVDAGEASAPSFADLDGDGDLDALVGEIYGNLLYFVNTGTATAPAFAAAAINPFGLTDVGDLSADLSADLSRPSFADLDGDGDLDVVVGELDGTLSYFENTGTAIAPAFATAVGNPFGFTGASNVFSAPSFADLDGDGDLDALVGGFGLAPGLLYFQNVGTATAPAFAAAVANPFGLNSASGSNAPSFADLDGDGDLDVLVGQAADLRYFENIGTAFAPAFAAGAVNPNPFGLTGGSGDATPSFADLDGDGDLDLIVGNFDGGLRYFENTTPPPALITITVTAENDAPAAQDGTAGGNEDAAIAGTLVATDPDNSAAQLGYVLVAQAVHGTVVVNADGTFSYTPDPDFSGADSFSFKANDGALDSNTATVNLSVGAVNDAPVNMLPGLQQVQAGANLAIAGLSIADLDAGAGAMTTTLSVAHGTLTIAPAGGAAVAGSGTGTVVLSGTLAQINATLGAASNVVYRGTGNFSGAETLTVTTSDDGNTGAGGALTDTDQVTINVDVLHLVGTPGDDSFAALPGNARIDALGGIDTISFNFKLTDATVSYSGNQVIIDSATSHTVLTGFEIYAFTDGTVSENDDDPLVADLFYYAQNHDVWNARVDADQHYHGFGRHEGRDPSAFFSTSLYLSANPGVAAAGVDPLVHFDQFGWKEGRVPSLTFDPAQYLAANPDVAVAQIDPLAHFLANGAQEGRLPFALPELLAANGFDYVYYLQQNPDVAAAHLDPLWHFQTAGWQEGRNPNALFDTAGYLAAYADVQAAQVNPLDHYNTFGWLEGRDPSVDFDTAAYLAANADVAAANVNPLTHFLESGRHEGRLAFADGHFA